MKPTARAWPLLAVAGAASLLLALAVGSVPVSPAQLLATLAGQGDSAARDVIWQLRAPRAVAVLDPLKPERIDHLAIAVVCLLVTFVAIIWSVITALPYFQ